MKVILFFRNLIFRVLDLVLGKTGFFIVILGYFFIISSVFMLISPQRARNKLVGIGFNQIKWFILLAALYLLSIFASLGGRIGTWLTFAGFIFAIIFYFEMKKKTFAKIQERFSKIRPKFLRFFALFQLFVGVLMVVLSKRIW